MKPVARAELLDWETWSEQRAGLMNAILRAKELRRIHVGRHLTFLFENHDTIRYQIHEMLRTEQIVREKNVQHELDTYNELLGGEGELGCTLLIEIDDEAERDVRLREWLDLPQRTYVELADGTRIAPRIDERQRSDRLSAVQYLKYDTRGAAPVAVGVDLPGLQERTVLSEEQRAALVEDLAS